MKPSESEFGYLAPQVVILFDCEWKNGRYSRIPVAVAPTEEDAQGIAVLMIRAWSETQPSSDRIALEGDPGAVIREYERATNRRIETQAAAYYPSAQMAQLALPVPNGRHDPAFDAAPGETLEDIGIVEPSTDTDA